MSNSNTYKALIVDDDTKILDLMKMNLELNGINCFTTSNPELVIKNLGEYKPHIIISDINMPVLDGFALRKKILEENEIKDIPFVFLTSNEEENKMIEGFNLNINDYIVKTTSPNVLIKKINSIFESSLNYQQKVQKKLKREAYRFESFNDKEKYRYENLEVSFLRIPFENIPGGDFFDKIHIDDERYVFIMADVMGKKWDAWFHSFPFRNYIKGAVIEEINVQDSYDVANVLKHLNESLNKDGLISSHSVALTIMLVNSADSTIHIAGAGSLPLLKMDSKGFIEKISPIQCAPGFSKNTDYKSQTIQLVEGDILIAFTDGLVDLVNNQNEQLGLGGMTDLVKEYHSYRNFDWIETKIRELASKSISDDLTLFEIKNITRSKC